MVEQQEHKALKVLGFLTVGVIIFAVGIFVGINHKLGQALYNDDGEVQISSVMDLYSKTRSEAVDFDQYWEIWDKLKKNHIDQDISDVDLFYASLEGLVAGLDDPYSVYFPPEKAEAFAQDLSGEFEGIGAEIGLRENQLTVIAPLPGSPAETSGLRAGDKIVQIDGEDSSGLSLEEAVSRIRGEKGTTVILTVTQNGYDTLEDISIIRDTINVPTVTWETEQDGIIYLRVSYFNETTWHEFDKAVKEIMLENPQGIILDLRSNPGGYLDTSVKVAAEWVETGIIVSQKDNHGDEDVHTARNGKHRFVDIQTVVLIDEGTASGSEIVAGALQDYGLATVIGQTTFGKGSVQDFELLRDGSALKLTVAQWFTPKGRQINEIGISPDEIIDEMFVQIDGTTGDNSDDYTDVGLERALEILNL